MLETCTTPDKGWMGNPRRGASLGRSPQTREATMAGLREEIARNQAVMQQLRDPRQAYLFAHLDDSGRAELMEKRLGDYQLARLRLEHLETLGDDQRFHLRRVRLTSGGYDTGGAYWGHGGALYEAFTDGGEFMTTRVYARDSREAAKAEVREEYPDARFYR